MRSRRKDQRAFTGFPMLFQSVDQRIRHQDASNFIRFGFEIIFGPLDDSENEVLRVNYPASARWPLPPYETPTGEILGR